MRSQLLYYSMPIVKLAVFVICLLVFALPVGLLQLIPSIENLDNAYAVIVSESLLLLSIYGALFMMTKMYKPSTISSFFIPQKRILKELFGGALLGGLIIGFCAVLLLMQGYVSFLPSKIGIAFFLLYIVHFLVVALFEEALFRTYPLFVFAESYPIVISVLINGLLFGLLHILNPGFTGLAMINITLAGILFSLFTLYYQSISWAIGIHLGWNFTQGILLGYKVSGSNTPSLLTAKPIGENYLSGGSFGMEGSLTCTLLLFAIIIFFAIKFKIPSFKEKILEEYELTRTR